MHKAEQHEIYSIKAFYSIQKTIDEQIKWTISSTVCVCNVFLGLSLSSIGLL